MSLETMLQPNLTLQKFKACWMIFLDYAPTKQANDNQARPLRTFVKKNMSPFSTLLLE